MTTAYFSRLLPVKIRQPSRHTSARFQSFRTFEILELVAPEFCHLTSCRRFRGAFFSGRFHFLFRLRLIIVAQRFPFIILNIKLVLRRRRQFIIFLCFVFFFIITINLSLWSREVVGGKLRKKFK